MQSLRSSHIWLIQPTESLTSITPIDAARGDTVHFSPEWSILCLQAYLRDRTGHTCEFIDTRLYDSTNDAIARMKEPRYRAGGQVALIYTTVLNLSHAIHLTQTIRAAHPSMTLVLFGPFPTAFPEQMDSLNDINFALCGDPEIALRNLLEFSDVEQRLKQTAGLIIPGNQLKKGPHWAMDLRQVSIPDWDGSIWRNYETGVHHQGARIEARLSRGTYDTMENIAFPGSWQPVRLHNLDNMASLIHRCPGHGVEEVFLNDPPGFWTKENIYTWCEHLHDYRNSQAWAFQMIPRAMDVNEIKELSFRGCSRIELIIPSFDPDVRAAMGWTISDKKLNVLITELTKNYIKPQLIYWIEGPGNVRNEGEAILKHIQSTHALDFAIYPFPLHYDSKIYADMHQSMELPLLTDWISWAKHPDLSPQPLDIWTGAAGFNRGQKAVQRIQRKLIRNPWMRFLRFLKRYRLEMIARAQHKDPGFSVHNPDGDGK